MARQALGPATLVAVQAVESALDETDQRLLVACSGGSDSLALAVAAVEVRRRTDRPIAAAVVDHGLQPDSAGVAERAAAQLANFGIVDVTVESAQVDRAGQGVEAAARDARYAVLRRLAEQRRATVVLGHTLDDQAESVLLGLLRGSGARSLAGMAVRNGCLLRPLLAVSRDTLRTVCREAGLDWWSDPHNDDTAYARSRTRTRVLPGLEAELGPGVAAALARTARLLRDDADLLDELASASVPSSAAHGLECAAVVDLAPALRRRVLLRWLRDAGGTDVSFEHVGSVERLITHWHGQRWVEVPGVRVRRVGERLLAERT